MWCGVGGRIKDCGRWWRGVDWSQHMHGPGSLTNHAEPWPILTVDSSVVCNQDRDTGLRSRAFDQVVSKR